MTRKKQLYEGKAKVIFEGPEAGTLVQYFKDDATAFNAQKKDVIKQQKQPTEPVWLYIPSDHPLARSSTIDEYIRQRPFLEEILLNGRVSDNRY